MKDVRVGKFVLVGTFLALSNFAIYTFLARVVMSSNELLWLDSMISYIISTILAYIMHSRITWRERRPGRLGVPKFFLWNFLTALLISPVLTWFFKLLTPFYEWAFSISQAIHLPFDFEFIESTGVFCLTTCITMILNYLFYDKLVFGDAESFKYDERLKDIKVSVVVPIYNAEDYLTKCLNSLVRQTHQNLEIILVDDGSTDGSGEIIKQFAKKDRRVKVIRQKNAGQSAARNAGLMAATGEFVSFVDSDDEVKKDFVAELLAPYRDGAVGLTVCGIHYKRLKQKTVKDVYTEALRKKRKHEIMKAYVLYLLAVDGRMYSSVNKLYKADLAKKCRFDEKLNFAEDTKFVLDYLARGSGRISFVLKPLYIYNFGTTGSTIGRTGVKWENWEESYRNLKKWVGKKPRTTEKFWLKMVRARGQVSYRRTLRRASK